MPLMLFRNSTKILLMLAFLTSLLYQAGCISMRKKPRKLFEAVLREQQTFDAIIVPGVPFKNGHWDSTMKGRVLWSYVLYKSGIAKNIIYSGGAVYSPYYEARIMGLYAQKLGVPQAHIFYDTLAEHSTENIYYSYELARKLGFKSIALATDPLQSKMTRSFTRKKFGTPIVHMPFVIDTLEAYNHLDPVIDPAPAYKADFKSIIEREGFWKRFRGTLGRHIPWPEGQEKKAAKL